MPKRLPRPDEIIKYERFYRNETTVQQDKIMKKCQNLIECPERL